MHKLTIEDDEGKTVVVPVIRTKISIGRQEGNTIRLTEQNISREHACLVREGDQLFVEDCGSYNGVRVNGAPIKTRQSLSIGDEIFIGNYRMGIRNAEEADEAVPHTETPTLETAAFPSRATLIGPAHAPAVSALSKEAAAAPEAPAPAPEAQAESSTSSQRSHASESLKPEARLVVVSKLLKGETFDIESPSVVIGRTPENDVVLNHRSISRHHAKIVRNGHRFVVVDLESANGVRVNGSPEERMELDSGDTLELGHVKVCFLIGDDTPKAGFSLPTSPKAKLLLGATGAAVALAVFLMIFDGRKTDTSKAGAPAVPADIGLGAVAPPDDSSRQAPEESASQGISAADHLNDAARAIETEDWDGALLSARKAAQLEPESERVRTVIQQIQADKTGAASLSRLQDAAQAGDLTAMEAAAGAIPESSRFHREIPSLLALGQRKASETATSEAQKLAANGRCEEAINQAQTALRLDPDNKPARTVINLCRRAPTRPRNAKPAPRRPSSVAARPVTAERRAPSQLTSPSKPVSSPADADKHIQSAQDSWLRGQYAAAIAASRKALAARPGLMKAYQIIAVCSCSLRDRSGATQAFQRLDDRNRQLVRSLCQKNGITFD